MVVDIGTGTVVLAVAAAKAGARKVYAIEQRRLALTAKEIFKANGVEHIVELIQGWSTDISLPEKAHVIITETIGNRIFDENILRIVEDAKK